MAERVTESWKRNPIVRVLASFTCGVTLLTLVLTYACVFSALPQVRGAMEMTEMQAFGHWLFVLLIAALCTSVIVATLARIRFNLTNAGVLTVHLGILTLCGGSLWYFGTKVEGDVFLRTPRIELVSNPGDKERVIAALPAERGENWSATMPAFGGEVSLLVTEALLGMDGGVERARVQVQFGANPPTMAEVVANTGVQMLGERLALRLTRFAPQTTFYDRENAAIYVRPATANSEWRSAALTGLPMFRERYLDEGYVLRDSSGKPEPSKRSQPALSLGPIAIPTGWFERWRMPLEIPGESLTPKSATAPPFDIQITGYVPYTAGFVREARQGGTEGNPGINLRLQAVGTEDIVSRSLFSNSPTQSIIPAQSPIEFRWAADAAEREALLSPLAGARELSIEVRDPPVTQRIAIERGQTIKVDGTDYELTINDVFPAWPLVSPGFEGASSPALLVGVKRRDMHYTRTVIQRFPALSQDIDEKGMRRREGPYDPNIVLRYRTSESGWLLLVGDAESASAGKCNVGVFDVTGKVTRVALVRGTAQQVVLPTIALNIAMNEIIPNARMVEMPMCEPLERRKANIAVRAASAIRVKFIGKGALAGWTDTDWCEYSDYPNESPRSIVVRPPNSQPWEVAYSRLEHQLGFELIPGRLSVKFFPGRRSAESWHSDFSVRVDENQRPTTASVFTNATTTFGNWTLFQSGAAQDHWSYTILGVGNRNGIYPMVLGCVMIVLGCLFAFYVKPVLIRRRQLAALAEAEARGKTVGGRRRVAEPVAEKVGV